MYEQQFSDAVTLVDFQFLSTFFNSVPSDFIYSALLTQHNRMGHSRNSLIRPLGSPPVLPRDKTTGFMLHKTVLFITDYPRFKVSSVAISSTGMQVFVLSSSAGGLPILKVMIHESPVSVRVTDSRVTLLLLSVWVFGSVASYGMIIELNCRVADPWHIGSVHLCHLKKK